MQGESGLEQLPSTRWYPRSTFWKTLIHGRFEPAYEAFLKAGWFTRLRFSVQAMPAGGAACLGEIGDFSLLPSFAEFRKARRSRRVQRFTGGLRLPAPRPRGRRTETSPAVGGVLLPGVPACNRTHQTNPGCLVLALFRQPVKVRTAWRRLRRSILRGIAGTFWRSGRGSRSIRRRAAGCTSRRRRGRGSRLRAIRRRRRGS